MINYNWNCRTVDVYPQNGEYADLVYAVHWIVTGTHDAGDESSTSMGVHSLNIDGITSFIPFEELTHVQIVDWVKNEMGTDLVTQIETNINSQIENLITPTSITKTIEL